MRKVNKIRNDAASASAGPPIGRAVTAARTVPGGLICVIARVIVMGTNVAPATDAHLIITTPEIRRAAVTSNAQGVRAHVFGGQFLAPMDSTSLNRCGRECRQAEACGRDDDESELSRH